MSARAPAVSIPARLPVSDLAQLIEVSVEEVQAVLVSRGEPSSPTDMIGPESSADVASTLGRRVRIESRDLALEALYEFDARGETETGQLPDRAAAMVEGVLRDRERLDHEIEAASEHWSVARMPAVDRTILRLGLYELESQPDTPTAVIVSEAVRLAQTYSTEKSGAFVNGVLAALARAVRHDAM
jgi:N utilization substance protein B